jgi:chromosome segregation ATPase
MADQLSEFVHDLTRQIRESKNEQRRTQERLDALQAEYDAVQGRLHILQDADLARSQRLQSLQEEHRSTKAELEDAHGSLQSREALLSSIRNALEHAPGQSVAEDQRREVQTLLESMVQSPRDIEILIQAGQHAPDIASIVSEATELRAVLEGLNSALEQS